MALAVHRCAGGSDRPHPPGLFKLLPRSTCDPSPSTGSAVCHRRSGSRVAVLLEDGIFSLTQFFQLREAIIGLPVHLLEFGWPGFEFFELLSGFGVAVRISSKPMGQAASTSFKRRRRLSYSRMVRSTACFHVETSRACRHSVGASSASMARASSCICTAYRRSIASAAFSWNVYPRLGAIPLAIDCPGQTAFPAMPLRTSTSLASARSERKRAYSSFQRSSQDRRSTLGASSTIRRSARGALG